MSVSNIVVKQILSQASQNICHAIIGKNHNFGYRYSGRREKHGLSPASIQEVVKSAHPWKRSPKKPNTVLHKDPFVKRTGSFFYANLRLSAAAGKTKGGDSDVVQ